MVQTALILGASGRFGRASAAAFRAAGWQVLTFDRSKDDLNTAVETADVIVNAWNPPDYRYWATELLPIHQQVIDALKGSEKTVIVPGNVYVFGAQTALPWSETTPHAATNPLGRLRVEMEATYRASGVKTILLRGGDFLDTEASGNWFDAIMVKKLAKGQFTYPGPLDTPHSWAFLPDMARAVVALAEKRADLPRYTDVAFDGYTLTGAQMAEYLRAATGREIKVKRMAWWPLRLGQVVAPFLRGLVEMRYLWSTPHALDGIQFRALLPEFEATPPELALVQAVAHLPDASGRAQVHPDKAVAV